MINNNCEFNNDIIIFVILIFIIKHKENYENYFENAHNKDAYKNYVKKDFILKKET